MELVIGRVEEATDEGGKKELHSAVVEKLRGKAVGSVQRVPTGMGQRTSQKRLHRVCVQLSECSA